MTSRGTSDDVHPTTLSFTYWVLPCLEELTKIDEVEKFFREHRARSVDRLWRGYVFALVIILGSFVDLILLANPFVEDDFILSRTYEGQVPFERMPADSPRVSLCVRLSVSKGPCVVPAL